MTDHSADAGAGGSGSLDPAMMNNGGDQGLVEAPSAVAQVGGGAPENDQAVNNNNHLRRADINSTSAAAADSSNNLATKKRVADRQITDRDYEDEDDNDMAITGEFTKADAATLAKRRIVKVKRPVAQHDESKLLPTTGETATNSNPFAGVKLSSSTKITNNTSSVDGATGSSSNPFAAIALKAGGSTGTESAVFGSGSGFIGFGSNQPTTSFAFGGGTSMMISTNTATTPTTTPLGLFGNSASTSNGLGASWFSTPSGATPFSFASAAAPSAVSTSNDRSDAAATTDSKKEVLPEHVELSTGEEEEQLMVEVRVKTHKRVLETTPKSDTQDNSVNKPHSSTSGDKDGSTPSVPPSSATAPMLQKTNGDAQKVETSAEKQDEAASSKDNSEDKTIKGSHSDSKPVGQDEGGAQVLPWRWQEVGTGPLRLLGRAVDSNASSPKHCRLVQRRESTPNGPATKVIVNINLWKETTIQRPSEKHVQVTTLVESESSSPVPETYLFRLKAPSDANQLQQKLEELVSKAKSCVGSE